MNTRTLMAAVTAALLTAAPLLAQEKGVGGDDAGGYVTGFGGFARSFDTTTGNLQLEGAVRIAPHVRSSATSATLATCRRTFNRPSTPPHPRSPPTRA